MREIAPSSEAVSEEVRRRQGTLSAATKDSRGRFALFSAEDDICTGVGRW